MNWVVLTVGLNPLPCLVEAYRLAVNATADGAYPGFLILRSEDHPHEAKGIRQLLEDRLSKESGRPVRLIWNEVKLSDPRLPQSTLREAEDGIKQYLKQPGEDDLLYYAHTGGTKVMSLHSLEALRKLQWKPKLAYLHPSHRIVASDDSGASPGDERYEWHLSLDQMARLHGFQRLETPGADKTLDALSQQMLGVLQDNGRREAYERWLTRDWKAVFPGGGDGSGVWIERLPVDKWPNTTVKWLGPGQQWAHLAETFSSLPVFGQHAVWKRSGNEFEIEIRGSHRQFLVPLFKFLDHQFLEIYVERELRALLPAEVPLEHSLVCRDVASGKDFELDVAVLLGYQLIGISCTYSAAYKSCKQKGFEIIHRVRQIGGDHARAALVCLLPENKRLDLESELRDEIGLGHDGRQFRVFGRDALDDAAMARPVRLRRKLRSFLEDLEWDRFADTDTALTSE